MDKSRYLITIISIFYSLLFVGQVYSDDWIDSNPYLREEAIFLNQVLAQDEGLRLAPALADVDTPPAYKIGDKREFYALDMRTTDQYELSASVRGISDKAYIFVEEGRSVTTAKANSLLKAFDRIYDTITKHFGPAPDSVDRDPRIYILILNIPDQENPNGSRVLGYYSSINQFRNAVLARWTNRRSNEVEILYIDHAALTGTVNRGEGIIGHEFAHMVQWARDPNESTWVNEGIAVYAEQMLGYGVESRISAYEENIDISLIDWNDTLEDYGAAYLFFAYISERFDGNASIASIVKNRGWDTIGIERALATLGKSVSFDKLFSDWVIANYLDDPKLGDGIYGYTNLDIEIGPSEIEDLYPINSRASKVKPWAARYTEFKKEQDDTLSLTVYESDRDDIVGQIITFGDQTSVSSVKSNANESGTALIPPEGNKAILVVTSQPDWLVPGLDYSDYKYSAEIQAIIAPMEPAANASITTWGAIKRN